jgi:S-adenosylmethionine synthetase
MKVVIRRACTDPDDMPFDVAERKGVGHPDSLADLIADRFSQRYSTWCRERFGAILNHWVDKVVVIGASAEVHFGGFDIRRPVACHLIGKITDQIGSTPVPVPRLLAEVADEVLPAALGDRRILHHLRLHVDNTSGIAVDHDPDFYRPQSRTALGRILARETVANDTVVCVGAAHRGLAADLAVALERQITGEAFRRALPAVGTDVKVMVVRTGPTLDITVAVPLHPERVESWQVYRDCLAEAQATITAELKVLLDADPRARDLAGLALSLNTKDVPGRGYLAPFGTSLGKGDCGAVGRGNRYSGAIEPLRPASGEAPAGKNPVHHAGKIYTAVAAEAARRVGAEISGYAEITVVARNGGPLTDPAYVLVALDREVDRSATDAVENLVRDCLAAATAYPDRFLAVDPVSRFRHGGPAW